MEDIADIAYSELTGQWYAVVGLRKDGTWSKKYDVTEQIRNIIEREARQ